MNYRKAIYPGTFDPITLGHLDIIKSSAAIMDELVIAVLENGQKTPAFSVEERISMIESSIKDLKNVRVVAFSGLTVELARKENAGSLIRGLRAITDFEYEMQIMQINKTLEPELNTIFLPASQGHTHISSSAVRDVALHGGDISKFVPSAVEAKVKEKVGRDIQK